MPSDAEVGVFELALQRPGDIGQLAKILRPTVGIITTIGDAHLGFFRDCRELANTKWELIETLPSAEGFALLNFDSPFLSEWAERAPCRVLGYGIECSRATVRARAIDDSSLNGLAFTLETLPDRRRIQTKLLGRPNVYTVLAAVTAAEALGVDLGTVSTAIATFEPVAHRLQLWSSPCFGWLLDDSYNASPQATREALQTLARLSVSGHQKIFTFGGMLELGQHSAVAHREIAAEIARLKAIDRFFGLGELAAETGRTLITGHGWDPERVTMTSRRDELIEMINRQLRGGKNLILIKGSRAAELDRVVEALL
jgi:UDP-N-acetylmuramoyl-tripeptide--D-alanyl-D-alanine ligase